MKLHKILRSPKLFKRRLAEEAKRENIPDLEMKLGYIEKIIRREKRWLEFEKDPCRKDHGAFVYSVTECDDDYNLLEDFSWKEIKELDISKIVMKGDEYVHPPFSTKPNIVLLPDTNMVLSGREVLKTFDGDPAFRIDVLPIVKEEAKRGGLKRFRSMPPELFEKEMCLRGGSKDQNHMSELNVLNDCITDYFNMVMGKLSTTLRSNPRWTDEKIAQKAARHDYEIPLYEKQVSHLRRGNGLNIIADRLLVAKSCATNIAEGDDMAIVISQDADLKGISRLMHDEIVPLYMARSTYETLPGMRGKIYRLIRSENDLLQAAKEHLLFSETFFNSDENPRHSAGIVYNPRTDEFTFSTVPYAYTLFINKFVEYRMGKTSIIATARALRISPRQALERLITDSVEAQKMSTGPSKYCIPECYPARADKVKHGRGWHFNSHLVPDPINYIFDRGRGDPLSATRNTRPRKLHI